MIPYPKLFLGALCAVLGTALFAVCNALCVQRAANNVVTNTGQVTNTAASDEDYRVLLQVMADTRNIGGCLKTVGKTNSCDFTQCRVRLLRACGRYLGAHASSLRCALVGLLVTKRVETLLEYRGFRLVNLIATTLSDKLIESWHLLSSFF